MLERKWLETQLCSHGIVRMASFAWRCLPPTPAFQKARLSPARLLLRCHAPDTPRSDKDLRSCATAPRMLCPRAIGSLPQVVAHHERRPPVFGHAFSRMHTSISFFRTPPAQNVAVFRQARRGDTTSGSLALGCSGGRAPSHFFARSIHTAHSDLRTGGDGRALRRRAGTSHKRPFV